MDIGFLRRGDTIPWIWTKNYYLAFSPENCMKMKGTRGRGAPPGYANGVIGFLTVCQGVLSIQSWYNLFVNFMTSTNTQHYWFQFVSSVSSLLNIQPTSEAGNWRIYSHQSHISHKFDGNKLNRVSDQNVLLLYFVIFLVDTYTFVWPL